MSETLLRQWAMLRFIPRAPRRIDTKTLQDKLSAAGYDINLRSIQRDLNKLSQVLPLVGDEHKPQGWSWQADAAVFDVPGLDPQTALAFTLVEGYLTPLLPKSSLQYLKPYFHASHGVLDAQGNGLSRWADKVRVLPKGQPLLPPKIDPDVQASRKASRYIGLCRCKVLEYTGSGIRRLTQGENL
ncbi:MAG: hypothetical protein AB1766_06835 [Pseudomonadota bacterium]